MRAAGDGRPRIFPDSARNANQVGGFASRHPWTFSLALGVLFAFSQYVWRYLLPGAPELPRTLAEKTVACVIAVIVLTRLGWWRDAGFRRHTPRQWCFIAED